MSLNLDFILDTIQRNKEETGYMWRRPHGYYWVKRKGTWHICYMCSVGVWTFMETSASILKLLDSDFDEIDEHKIER